MSQGHRINKNVTRSAPVRFLFDGTELEAPEGESVAAALLACGIRLIRVGPKDRQPRGAFCYMGTCQECVVEIDGAKVEACRTLVAAGLTVNRVSYSDDATDDI